MPKKNQNTQPNPKQETSTLSQCYLGHAARETQRALECSEQCDYQAAANALMRRAVWLMSALIAQERGV